MKQTTSLLVLTILGFLNPIIFGIIYKSDFNKLALLVYVGYFFAILLSCLIYEWSRKGGAVRKIQYHTWFSSLITFISFVILIALLVVGSNNGIYNQPLLTLVSIELVIFLIIALLSGEIVSKTSGAGFVSEERKIISNAFDADSSKGAILYRKEFVILDHIMPWPIDFSGKYKFFKELVLTDEAMYIVGLPSVEQINYKKIVSTELIKDFKKRPGYDHLEFKYENSISYIYINSLPPMVGMFSFWTWTDNVSRQIGDEFKKIKKIVDSHKN